MEDLPANLVRRADESDDALFYGTPRLVTHIDDATIAALTDFYRETIPAESRLLDMMSSWVSHLPPETDYASVSGLGMNAQELENNPRLDARIVHDLNANPELPYADESFDFVLNAVSVQYLTQPIRVFQSVARVLRPGGYSLVAISHRLFPTKAIYAWQTIPPAERPGLVEAYFQRAGSFDSVETIDRSPTHADPLWVVRARKA